jgi:hypothetical protein
VNSVIDAKGQRAGVAALERRDVLIVVRQAVQRLAASLRREDRALATPDELRGLERGRRDPCAAVAQRGRLAACSSPPS